MVYLLQLWLSSSIDCVTQPVQNSHPPGPARPTYNPQYPRTSRAIQERSTSISCNSSLKRCRLQGRATSTATAVLAGGGCAAPGASPSPGHSATSATACPVLVVGGGPAAAATARSEHAAPSATAGYVLACCGATAAGVSAATPLIGVRTAKTRVLVCRMKRHATNCMPSRGRKAAAQETRAPSVRRLHFFASWPPYAHVTRGHHPPPTAASATRGGNACSPGGATEQRRGGSDSIPCSCSAPLPWQHPRCRTCHVPSGGSSRGATNQEVLEKRLNARWKCSHFPHIESGTLQGASGSEAGSQAS